ncbi:hypothetical protein F01_10034 [Burkholderia cenocepacia]|nr:hypothetical protein F01_10034 [Burkholderia cenocepacia]
MPCAAGWRSRRTRRQDAHVNTSAAGISGAPPDGARRLAGRAPAVRSALSWPSVRPIGPGPRRDRTQYALRWRHPRRPASMRFNHRRIDLMGYPFATAALGPLLFAQGRYVRRVTPRLPEAAGPRDGSVGDGPPCACWWSAIRPPRGSASRRSTTRSPGNWRARWRPRTECAGNCSRAPA